MKVYEQRSKIAPIVYPFEKDDLFVGVSMLNPNDPGRMEVLDKKYGRLIIEYGNGFFWPTHDCIDLQRDKSTTQLQGALNRIWSRYEQDFNADGNE